MKIKILFMVLFMTCLQNICLLATGQSDELFPQPAIEEPETIADTTSNSIIGAGNFLTGFTGTIGATLELFTVSRKSLKFAEVLASVGWMVSGFLEVKPYLGRFYYYLRGIPLEQRPPQGPWITMSVCGKKLKVTAYTFAFLAALGYVYVYGMEGDTTALPGALGWGMGAGLEGLFNWTPHLLPFTQLPMRLAGIPSSISEAISTFRDPASSIVSKISDGLCIVCASAELGLGIWAWLRSCFSSPSPSDEDYEDLENP